MTRNSRWRRPQETRIFELLTGLLLIAVGIGLPALLRDPPPPPWLTVLGPLLAAVGGAYLSWVASSVASDGHVADELGRRLAPTAARLSQSSSTIVLNIQRGSSGEIPAELVLSLIEQESRHIALCISEISDLLGSELSNEKIRTLRELVDGQAQWEYMRSLTWSTSLLPRGGGLDQQANKPRITNTDQEIMRLMDRARTLLPYVSVDDHRFIEGVIADVRGGSPSTVLEAKRRLGQFLQQHYYLLESEVDHG